MDKQINTKLQSFTVLLLVVTLAILTGCSQKSTERGAQGAAIGGVAGAVGGIVTSLVFGGNVGEAAARSVVFAASAGAVAGSIQGAQENAAMVEAEKQKRIAALQKQLGDDAFNGLVALAECKHEIALGYARTAAKSDNDDFALAGLWLEILTEKDRGNQQQALELSPKLIEKDQKLQTEAEVSSFLQEAAETLQNVRKDYNLKPQC